MDEHPQNNRAYDELSLTPHFGNVLDPEGFARHKERREHVLDIHMPRTFLYISMPRTMFYTYVDHHRARHGGGGWRGFLHVLLLSVRRILHL